MKKHSYTLSIEGQRSSFGEMGVQECVENEMKKLLKTEDVKIYFESIRLIDERPYDPDGDPNMDFELSFEVNATTNVSLAQAQQLLEEVGYVVYPEDV